MSKEEVNCLKSKPGDNSSTREDHSLSASSVSPSDVTTVERHTVSGSQGNFHASQHITKVSPIIQGPLAMKSSVNPWIHPSMAPVMSASSASPSGMATVEGYTVSGSQGNSHASQHITKVPPIIQRPLAMKGSVNPWIHPSMAPVMARLSTNTVTVPSASNLERPISSSVFTPIPYHDTSKRSADKDPLGQGGGSVIIQRRRTRLQPNPKTAHSIEMKVSELRHRYVLTYIDGIEPDKRTLCNQLISLDAPINKKYKELDLEELLQKNKNEFRIKYLAQSLSIQERYASNLIKASKPQFWRSVKFTSNLWKTYLENINGSKEILKQMGYTKELRDGLSFPDNVPAPDVEHVKELAADLYLAKLETDDLINDRHPYFVVEKFIPQQRKMEESVPAVISQPYYTKQETALVYTSAGKEGSASEDSDSEYQDAKDVLSNEEDNVTHKLPVTTSKQENATPAPECYVCGSATVCHCNDCKYDFCQKCDTSFHNHRDRQHHARQRTGIETSLPRTDVTKTGDEISLEVQKYENVVPSKPLSRNLEEDGIKARIPPVPKPRKRIPSKTSNMPSSVNLQTMRSAVDNTANSEELPPPFYTKREIQNPIYYDEKMIKVPEKVPQQPTGQGIDREILRPPAVTNYEPVKEPLKILLLPANEEPVYESLKDHGEHIYQTLDNQSKEPTPPPLPPRHKMIETKTVPFQKGTISCPHCYCFNTPDATSCVACGTTLPEQPPSSVEPVTPRHEQPKVKQDPWQSTPTKREFQALQKSVVSASPTSVENPVYLSSKSSTPTAKVEVEKASSMDTASPHSTSKSAEVQWECEFCTLWNPVDKKICEACSKTRSENAKMIKPHPAPVVNFQAFKPADPEPWTLSPEAIKFQEEEVFKKDDDSILHHCPSKLVQKMQAEEEDLIRREKEQAKQNPSISSPASSFSSAFFSSSESKSQEFVRSPREIRGTRLTPSTWYKELREARESGESFVKQMKRAESLGFYPEELNIAYNSTVGDPIQWLQTDWFDLMHEVMKKFTDISKIEDIGNLSPEEARQALIERTKDVERAVDLCKEERKKGLKKVMESGFYPRTDCVTALDNNDGDVEKSIQELQIMSFQPMLQRIYDSCTTDNADGIEEWQLRRIPDRQLSSSHDEELFEAMVSNKELQKDRRIRVMLAEKNLISWGRAETAIRLIDMDFPVYDSIEAARASGTLERSLQILQRECILCTEKKSEYQMVTMLNCQCRFCIDCVTQYVRIVIQEQNIMKLVCPQCSEPKDLDDDQVATEYFNNLDIMIRRLVDQQTHDLFQRKLRDRTLMKEPNFRWCSHCSSGFINERPEVIKMACLNCHKYTCFECKKQWEDQHEGISCEQFAAWKEANDPEAQANGLAAHLKQNGIECPNCKFRYDLAKGGCMHFKCNQCAHEFCSGCYQPFRHGNRCPISENCARRGLHAHHPRDCLFHLRDRDPEDLKKLLDDHNVQYNTEPPEGQAAGEVNQGFQQEAEEEVQGAAAAVHAGRCKVMEQRETTNGLEDDECGRETLPGFAGLCRLHFTEYLVERINTNLIDPVGIFSVKDLEIVITRNDKEVPARKSREKDPAYKERLIQFVQAQLPLPRMPPRRRVLNIEEAVAEDQIHLVVNEEARDGPGNRNVILGGMGEIYNVELRYSDGESNDGFDGSDANDIGDDYADYSDDGFG